MMLFVGNKVWNQQELTSTNSKEWPYIGGKVSLFSIYGRGSPAFSKSSPSCYITDNFPQQRRSPKDESSVMA